MFSTQKSLKHSSKIGLDQAHEQLNCKVKADGDAIGLFDSEEGLKRCVVADHIVLKFVEEFKRNSILFDCDKMDEHHENYPSFQKSTNDKIKPLHFVSQSSLQPFSGKRRTR